MRGLNITPLKFQIYERVKKSAKEALFLPLLISEYMGNKKTRAKGSTFTPPSVQIYGREKICAKGGNFYPVLSPNIWGNKKMSTNFTPYFVFWPFSSATTWRDITTRSCTANRQPCIKIKKLSKGGVKKAILVGYYLRGKNKQRGLIFTLPYLRIYGRTNKV